MKKLMIAAAAAAMVGGAFAALPESGDAIVEPEKNVGVMHNVAITVKTLMPTVSKSSKGCVICPADSECYFFEQGTLKLNGIFASCNCKDMFEHGYFWLGSGKSAVKLFDKLPATATNYDDLPKLEDLGLEFEVNRYGNSAKKAVVGLAFDDGGDVVLTGFGFGTYTAAKYSYNKSDDEYTLKTAAKVSASGSVIGTVNTTLLATYLVDQKKLSAEDAEQGFKLFPVTDGCTVELDCVDDGDVADEVPVVGTFTVKSAAVKALSKVIPAVCWEK